MPSLLSRIRGSLLAGACGDALGYPIEFMSISSITNEYRQEGVKDMILTDDKACISDDTQMSVYTAQGLIHAFSKGCNYNQTLEEIHKSYYRWYRAQTGNLSDAMKRRYPIEEIEYDDLLCDSLNQPLREDRAPGLTCLSGLDSGEFPTTTRKVNNSKGCGGIMRIAPIPAIYYNNPNLAYHYAVDASALTHSHILGYTSSGALAMILSYIYQDYSLRTSIEKTLSFLRKDDSNDELVQVIQDAVQVADEKITGDEAFSRLGEGWVGEEALAIALWASLLYPTDIKKALLASVNHSGDSDSTGAICGYIMGALLGEEAIPSEWISHLELKKLISSQAESLYQMSTQFALFVCLYRVMFSKWIQSAKESANQFLTAANTVLQEVGYLY